MRSDLVLVSMNVLVLVQVVVVVGIDVFQWEACYVKLEAAMNATSYLKLLVAARDLTSNLFSMSTASV